MKNMSWQQLKLFLNLKLILSTTMAFLLTIAWVDSVNNPGNIAFAKEKKVLIAAKKTKRKKRKGIDDPVVLVKTNKGEFAIQVFQEEVPVTAQNFLSLVEKGFYDGLTFHRYDPRFVIQGGDPTGTGTGGSGKNIPLEINKTHKHSEMGMVGMARKSDPNSGSSQFYIILSPRSELDEDYCVYGKVIEGLDIVYQLRKGDKMERVYLEKE